MSIRPIWRTPVGVVLTSSAALGVVLLAICLRMVQHLHAWLLLPYFLLVALPIIALVVYAIQVQHERDRHRHV